MAPQPAKHLFQKRGVYYFERRIPTDLTAYYNTPKLIRSLKTKNPQQACKLASCLAQRLDNPWAGLRSDTLSAFFCGQQATPPTVITSHCAITMQDALTDYLRHKGRGKGERFRRYAERSVGYLIKVAGDKPLSSYTRADANTLRDMLIKRGLVASSIKRNFEVVRAVFNVTVKEAGLELVNPFSQVILSGAKQGRVRPAIPADVIYGIQALCYAANDDMRWLIALLSDTGMRLAEACGLLISDICLDTELPYIELTEHPWRSLKTRGSKRQVPLVGASLWAAQRIKETSTSEYAFPRYCSEERAKADFASNALNKWMRPHVPQGCVVHSFRHSLRDRLRAVECPSDIIDQIGGWQTSGVGQRYGQGYSLVVIHKWLSSLQ